MASMLASQRPHARSALRAVALPTEHGGWGLTLEPVVLGLLVAPSGAGLALGVAAFVAFLARTPIKVVLVDRSRGRRLPRTATATRVAAVESMALVALVTIAAVTAVGPFWWPLVVALPLVATELWFDMHSRSRRLIPELAGTFGIAAVAPAIALADGRAGAVAAGLWLVLVSRAVASIPFVRVQLARGKQQPHRVAVSDAAQVVALAITSTAWALGWVPLAAMAVIAALAVVETVLVRVPPPRAAIVGAQQMVFGLTVVLVTALAVLAPH